MAGTLRLSSGPNAGETRQIDHELVVGRKGADVELSDPGVSRRHAVLRPVASGVELEDLRSTNGTYVDEQRVEGKVTLTANATVRVGDTRLMIEIPVAADPQATRARAADPLLAPPDGPVAPGRGAPPRARPRLPLVIGGLVIVAGVALGLSSLLGGSGKKAHPAARTSSRTASRSRRCASAATACSTRR
jgi:S-DNA-T family DNA segregation ATPase FtsK/SpoIIIE